MKFSVHNVRFALASDCRDDDGRAILFKNPEETLVSVEERTKSQIPAIESQLEAETR